MYNRVFKHPMLSKQWPHISLIHSTKFHEKNLFRWEMYSKIGKPGSPWSSTVHGTSTTIIHTLNLILIQPNMSNLLHVFTYEIAWQSRDCFTLCSSHVESRSTITCWVMSHTYILLNILQFLVWWYGILKSNFQTERGKKKQYSTQVKRLQIFLVSKKRSKAWKNYLHANVFQTINSHQTCVCVSPT